MPIPEHRNDGLLFDAVKLNPSNQNHKECFTFL